MAITSSSRRLSFSQPSTSPVSELTPLRSPATSHYRPYSTIHISEAESEPRRRSIIRSPSFAGMGFSFMDKSREREKGKGKGKGKGKDQGSPGKISLSPKPFDTCPNRSEPPLIAVASPPPDRPSTSNGLYTPSKEKGLKKKRSLSSLLSAASESSPITNIFPSRSGSHSPVYIPHTLFPLGTSDSLQSSSAHEPNSKGNPTIKVPEVEKNKPRRRPTNNFVRKNTWLKRQNMKVHPYLLEATYMQAYEPLQLENDRYTDILLRRLNPLVSPSFHDYGRKIPLYALDLGCGSGHWLLEASNAWKTSQITGFDLVDILVPEVLSQDNIQFIRGNFLIYPLPFADKSFDLVRIANLSLCIPYDKWEFVFSEVQRVLTIDGRLELIDDQIFFPYGQPPATPPASSSASASFMPTETHRESSWFDDDEHTLADDSTGDGHSMETDYTFISDPDLSSSSHDKQKLNFVSLHGDTALPHPSSPDLPMPQSPDDPDTPRDMTSATDVSTTTRSSPWSAEAEACKDMETVFQNMLNHKFGIHTRPSDFILDMMRHVFGNGRKLKSFHLKLAPRDQYTNFGNISTISTGGSVEGGSDRDEKSTRINANVPTQKVNETPKPWFTVEWDNDDKKRLKRERKLGKLDASRRDEDFRPHTPDVSIPEGISAKAAGRLGISENTLKLPSIPEKVYGGLPERLGVPGTRERKASHGCSVQPPILEEVDETSTDGESVDPIPSANSTLTAKAGSHLLTLNTVAITSARDPRPRSFSSSSSTSSVTSQSPGLLLWPTTFLPLSPSELEMHACKHVHTLLGCKPALVEFIEAQVDEHGARLVTDEGFRQAIWDYECFRRRRFHWPSEIPEWDQDITDESSDIAFPKPGFVSPPISRTTSGPSTEVFSTSPLDISASSTRPYIVDELTHVRTIRIFEAVKTNEYSSASLQFPRPPPPIPSPKA